MKLEYCLSGMAYTRGALYLDRIPSLGPSYSEYFNQKSNGVDITCLFNAFTEVNMGQSIFRNIKSKKIYTDSGGLQMVLHNREVSKEAREKIYDIQRTNSHYAFCFDDIPLIMGHSNHSSSNRTTINNKYFDRNILKEKALRTSENIKEQAANFDRNGATTKIIPIVQGNCKDTFAEWANILFSNLRGDEIEYVGGIALADTCCGNDIAETVEMLSAVRNMNVPDHVLKQIHMLGIGSLKRLIPIIELHASPIFKDTLFSFDSTSHTSSYVMGKYVNEKLGFEKIAKHISKKTINMTDEIIDKYLPHRKKDQDFKDIILNNLGSTAYISEIRDMQEDLIMFIWSHIKLCIERFTYAIESCYNNPQAYQNYIRNSKEIFLLNSLREMNDFDDFDYWISNNLKYLDSKRIATSSSDLESLFA